MRRHAGTFGGFDARLLMKELFTTWDAMLLLSWRLKKVSGTEPEAKWTKPEVRSVKLNVYAAFHIDEGSGATAAVIRDHRGNFLAPQCSFVPFAADACTTEAMAMRDGLVLANSLGFNTVEAE